MTRVHEKWRKVRLALALALAYLVALQGFSTSFAQEMVDPSGVMIVCSHASTPHEPEHKQAPRPCCLLMASCAALHLMGGPAADMFAWPRQTARLVSYASGPASLPSRPDRARIKARGPPRLV